MAEEDDLLLLTPGDAGPASSPAPPASCDPGLWLLWGGGAPPAPLPYDLHEAAVARLRLMAPLRADEWGGWHSGPSSRKEYPSGLLVGVGESESYFSGSPAPTIIDGILQVSVFAVDRASARRLADSARDALFDAHLEFTRGRIRNLRPTGGVRVVPEPAPSIAGASLYHAFVQFLYTVDTTD